MADIDERAQSSDLNDESPRGTADVAEIASTRDDYAIRDHADLTEQAVRQRRLEEMTRSEVSNMCCSSTEAQKPNAG